LSPVWSSAFRRFGEALRLGAEGLFGGWRRCATRGGFPDRVNAELLTRPGGLGDFEHRMEFRLQAVRGGSEAGDEGALWGTA